MKKLVLALLAALLVLSVPAAVLAAPKHTTTPISGQISVWAVDRDLHYLHKKGIGPTVAGTVTYNGIVTQAMGGDWAQLLGANIVATEHVNYRIDPLGNVLPGQGKVEGTLTITQGTATVTVKYKADVWGNIFGGPAGDDGTWKVTNTDKPFQTLKSGEGIWTAIVAWDPNYQTLVGTVSIAGTY